MTILTKNKTTEQKRMKNKTLYLTQAALIAALYAALTYVSGAAGLAFSGIQFRLSEALTVLALFTPAAVPGLAVGCAVSNVFSTVNPADILIGGAATYLSAVLARRFRDVKIKGYPFVSVLMPVLFNAVFVGAELTVFYSEKNTAVKFFLTSCITVSVGEAAVCFTLGSAVIYFITKNEQLRSLLGQAELRRK